MMKKAIYISPYLKEVILPLRHSVCQQNSQILEYVAAEGEDKLLNSDDF